MLCPWLQLLEFGGGQHLVRQLRALFPVVQRFPLVADLSLRAGVAIDSVAIRSFFPVGNSLAGTDIVLFLCSEARGGKIPKPAERYSRQFFRNHAAQRYDCTLPLRLHWWRRTGHAAILPCLKQRLGKSPGQFLDTSHPRRSISVPRRTSWAFWSYAEAMNVMGTRSPDRCRAKVPVNTD